MKNLKKAAAVMMAAVMCMAMGMTAFAASPEDGDVPSGDAPVVEGDNLVGAILDKDGNLVVDENGNPVYVEIVNDEIDPNSETAQTLQNQEALKNILATIDVEVPAGKQVEVIAASELNVKGETPEGKILVGLVVEGSNEGDTVYVIHEKAPGEWEVFECTVVDGGVMVAFDHLSPVAIVKIVNGTPIVSDGNGNIKGQLSDNGEVKAVTAKTSPKTGE